MVYGDGIYGEGIYGGAATITPAPPRPTRLLYPNLTVEIDGDAHAVAAATKITLDAGAVPYATANVDLPLLDDAVLALLDPRSGDVRCPVTGWESLTGAPREFDLGLRTREVDHAAKTVTLQLASDEAMMQDHAALADDDTPFHLAVSLRDVVDYALGAAVGATLAAGADADVTPYWKLTNLHPNPTCAVGVGSYLAGGGCTIAWNSATGAEGAGFLRAVMSGATGAVYLTGTTTGGYSITPGRPYTVDIAARHSHAGASMTITLRWFNSDGALIRSDTSTAESLPTAWGSRFHMTATAPVGAARLVPFASIAGTASARNWDIDAVQVIEWREPVPFFHGSSSGGGYTYTWEDAANASPSVRTPVAPRDPDSLIWRAGQTAWNFVAPLCASVGMTLWCDEARVWRLQTPESRTVPALISVTAKNTRDGVDRLSRDDTDTFITGVVARYRWTDSDGLARSAVDAAGTPGKVLVQEFDNTAFPGPGLAAAMLARRAGTGRTQDVTAITRWDATPGMTAAINLPGAPETLGRVAAVTFHTDGFMELKHAGIVDIIPGSIAALTGTIDALIGTIGGL